MRYVSTRPAQGLAIAIAVAVTIVGCDGPREKRRPRRARRGIAATLAGSSGARPSESTPDEGEDIPPPPAETSPHVSVTPSPANVGWIGGSCEVAEQCTAPHGECLLDGFPAGLCTSPCTGACPARGERGDTKSFCVDGRPHGHGQGICLAQCDFGAFVTTGCQEGWTCAERNLYADPAVVGDVCVPARRYVCSGAEDALVRVPYPDRGAVWLPAELRCGDGPVDVVVLLHGLNGLRAAAPLLGGGLRLELLVRGLIDGGVMRPVVLAAPVHFQATSSMLYGDGFDPARHLELVEQALAPARRTIGTVSYIGHSGAGCHEQNGLYEVLARRRELARGAALHLWGLMDVCYEAPYHWEAPLAALDKEPTMLFNVYGEQGDPTAFEEHVFGGATTFPCDDSVYARCLSHPAHPWYSARARPQAGATHANNPYFFLREAFPRAFPPGG